MSNVYFRGDIVFLYIKFYDKNNNIIKNIQNPKVRILHENNEQIYEDLPWTDLNKLSEFEYFYNYKIPSNGKFGLYDVIYKGDYNGESAIKVDTFHVINRTEDYKNAIKIYGYIDDEASKTPLTSVNVKINSLNEAYSTESYTHIDGNWESYLYPGEYICTFSKEGFETETINIQLNDENNEIKFNNISMKSIIKKTSGNGAYKINDNYILKNGIPLDGLKVEVFNILKINEVIASTLTNNKGEWELFLDPGYYMLKVTGDSMNMIFNKTFTLKVKDDGEFTINDLENNRAELSENSSLDNGNGSKKYSDIITDKSNNPIVDVQVTVSDINNNIIAESYTDIKGKFEFNLDPGEYYLNIYHPNFKETQSIKITIKEND